MCRKDTKTKCCDLWCRGFRLCYLKWAFCTLMHTRGIYSLNTMQSQWNLKSYGGLTGDRVCANCVADASNFLAGVFPMNSVFHLRVFCVLN